MNQGAFYSREPIRDSKHGNMQLQNGTVNFYIVTAAKDVT